MDDLTKKSREVRALAAIVDAAAVPTRGGSRIHVDYEGDHDGYLTAAAELDELGLVSGENVEYVAVSMDGKACLEVLTIGALRFVSPVHVHPMADKYLPPLRRLSARRLTVVEGGGDRVELRVLQGGGQRDADPDPGDVTDAA